MARRWLVTRHPGARDWVDYCRIDYDCHVEHLDPELVQPGDVVIGTLPVHLAAIVCERGGRYLHLSLDLAPGQRGRELAFEDMSNSGARLVEYRVCRSGAGMALKK